MAGERLFAVTGSVLANFRNRCMAVSLLPQLSLLNDRENAAGQANRLSIS